MSHFAPDEVRELIRSTFSDPNRSAYGQVGTVSDDGHAHVCTVHLHSAPEHDAMAFNAHVSSSKWRHLGKRPQVSGCYFDTVQMIQFRFLANTNLISRTEGETVDPLLQRMWSSTREEVRLAYWLDLLGRPLTSNQTSDIRVNAHAVNFATVVCLPTQWDIYWLDRNEYRKGIRKIFTRVGDRWESRSVPPLHEIV